MEFLDQLKAFWVFVSTPGSQMPASTTFIALAIITAFTFLMPAFVQWRAYRRENPMESPKERAKQAATGRTNSAKSSGAKKNKKKKRK